MVSITYMGYLLLAGGEAVITFTDDTMDVAHDNISKAHADQEFSDGDTSGTGTVYYIATDGGDSTEPLDASVYEAWRYVYVRDSQEIQLEYLALTEENIRSILEG